MTMIRFEEAANQTIEFSTQEYIKTDLWYSQDDFRTWKERSRDMARSWRRRGFGLLLDHTFTDPPRNTLEKLTAISQLDEDNCFRGMERYLNEDHDEERSTSQQDAIEVVLRLRQQGSCSSEQFAIDLSVLYKEKTLSARQFAICQGQADEIAAREGDDPMQARVLMGEASTPLNQSQTTLTRWNSWSSVSSEAPQQPRRSLPADLLKFHLDTARQRLGTESQHQKLVECPLSPASLADELIERGPRLLKLDSLQANIQASPRN